jgi:predicted nucleic acid-binding protein
MNDTQYEPDIGIDSNTLTLLIEAVDPDYDPSSDSPQLVEEKKAILRVFLYQGIAYHVGPTVEAEYKKIQDNRRFQAHVSFSKALLRDGPWQLNFSSIKQRAVSLGAYHNGLKDCYILAEAEEMHLDALLTNDNDFLKHLGPVSKSTMLVRPSQFWDSLGVPKGTAPTWLPSNGNPLLQKTWWRW